MWSRSLGGLLSSGTRQPGPHKAQSLSSGPRWFSLALDSYRNGSFQLFWSQLSKPSLCSSVLRLLWTQQGHSISAQAQQKQQVCTLWSPHRSEMAPWTSSCKRPSYFRIAQKTFSPLVSRNFWLVKSTAPFPCNVQCSFKDYISTASA